MVIRSLSKGESRLLNWNRRGLLSVLSVTDNDGARYFDLAWLGKATSIFQKKQGRD